MNRRAILLFAFLGIAWGIPYLLIKIVIQEWDPSLLVLVRTAGAAILLLPIVIARGEVRSILRRWRPVLAYAALEVGIPWFFLGSAEQNLPSSTTGLLLAAVPLVGVGVALVLRTRQGLSKLNLLGLLVGAVGVSLLVGFDVGGSNLTSVAELAIVVVGYAIGPAILSRWLPDVSGVAVTAFSLSAVAVAYVPLVALRQAWPTAVPSGSVIGSVVVLILVCSAGAFVVLAALVKEVGAVRATTITYVNPAVALVAGAVVLGEPIGPASLVGFAIILAGCVLTALPPRRRAVVPDARGAGDAEGIGRAGRQDR